MANAALTTLNAVKQQLNIGQDGTLNTRDDDLITRYVHDASGMVESHCNRFFSDVTNGSGTLNIPHDCIYPAVNGRTLFLAEDLLSVGTLINQHDGGNGSTLTADQYNLLPTYGYPKYGIEIKKSVAVQWSYEGDNRGAIHVIGSWGFCTAAQRPRDITEAATRLAAWLYQTRDNDGSAIQTADGSTVIPPDAPPLVFKMLDRYVKRVMKA
jgi:hypothetical protein